MPPILMLRLIGIAVVALALYGVYWSIDNGGYERGVVAGKKEGVKQGHDDGVKYMGDLYRDAEIKRDKEQAERTKLAQEKHDADQKTIARLAADARRVRVNFPISSACASSEDTDGRGGVLQQRMEQLFAELQSRTGELVERCDELNAAAIRQNASLP